MGMVPGQTRESLLLKEGIFLNNSQVEEEADLVGEEVSALYSRVVMMGELQHSEG